MKRFFILFLAMLPHLVFAIDCKLIDAISDPVLLKCKLESSTKTLFMKKKNLLKMYWDTKALNLEIKISEMSPLYLSNKMEKLVNGCEYSGKSKTILPIGSKRKVCATSVKCLENGKNTIKVATCLERDGSCPAPYTCLTDNSVVIKDATFVKKSKQKLIKSGKGSAE